MTEDHSRYVRDIRMRTPFYFVRPKDLFEKNSLGRKNNLAEMVKAFHQEEAQILDFLHREESVDQQLSNYRALKPRVTHVRRTGREDHVTPGWDHCPVITFTNYNVAIEVALWGGGRIVGLYFSSTREQQSETARAAQRTLANVEDLSVWMPRLAEWKLQRPDYWAYEAILAETPHPLLCPICHAPIETWNCSHTTAIFRHIEANQ